jgi:hypothetical protein
MAINFLNTIDLNFNQLNKAAIQNLSGDPAAGVLGQIYYDTAVSALKICTTAQVVGVSNAVWTEVGATSGVETITIGNANVNSGGVNTGLVRTPVAGTGDIILTPAIYGGAANVGMVPTGGTANQYLDGAGNWVDVTTGDIESVNAATAANLLGINITTPLGPNPTVGLDIVGRDVLGGAPATGDQLLIYDLDTTKNKKVTVGNLVGGFETTYTIDVPTGTTNVNLKGSDSTGVITNDPITISGTANRTAVSRISASELRVDLTPNVIITNNATVGNDLTVNGVIIQTEASAGSPAAPLNTFAGQVQVPTATAGGNAPNLAQVELLIAGVGVFQGPYDATNDPGSPIISTNNNVALDQGDYFVVTVDGDITFSDKVVTVEVGDFIFANAAIAAGGGAGAGTASTQYTFVIADANLATAGTLTGAQRGVAGFDATTFNVTQGAGNDPGFVTLKTLANPYGANVTLTSGVTSGGQTTFTVDIESIFTQTGATALAENCKAEVIRAADLLTVYPEVSRNGSGDMLFKFIPAVADSAFKALITIV